MKRQDHCNGKNRQKRGGNVPGVLFADAENEREMEA